MNLSSLLTYITSLISQDPETYSQKSAKDLFADLTSQAVEDICNQVKQIFKDEDILLNLEGDFIVVGDLHGHFFDLIRIFNHFGLPSQQKYIFLGDTIDRGEFSLYTILSIFVMKCSFPSSIYIIRGNHEFENYNSGLSEEINELFHINGKNTMMTINQAFSYLPLAIVLNNEYLCVHGGIGPSFNDINQICNITRPFVSIYGGIANSLLWSDPNENIDTFHESRRGVGYEYGYQAIKLFLKNNNLKMLIRGHEVVKEGVSYSLEKTVVTVFSASNYCGELNNSGGVLIIKKGSPEKIFTFPPITPYVTRVKQTSRDTDTIKTKITPHRNSSNGRTVLLVPKMQGFKPISSLPTQRRKRVHSHSALPV
ncbi:hypothetical protein M9Y10_043779 [Tritrichomonas musculus]|uniref:Serine/threonine-protein phosphatase n=1 Tax=Tritrichomonas musculus TaxID=1915356 RepID=A0ABR2K1R2_9EUKA